MCTARFGNGAAHLDEFMGHAPVDLQVHGHAGHAQLVGVFHALIHQRVAFGQAYPGRGHAVHIGGQQRGKAPVLAVGGAVEVLGKEPGDGRLVNDQPVGETAVRVGVLVRRRARVDQQLQGQLEAGVARMDGAGCGQRAARAVAAHGQARRVGAQRGRLRGQPLQRVPGVVVGRGEFVLWRAPIVQRDHHGARQMGQLAAQHVVRGHAAHGEAAAVQVQQHGQARGRRLAALHGRIEPRRQQGAIARGNLQILDTQQNRLGNFEHAGPRLVGGTCALGAQLVQGRARGALHAAQHIAHLVGQGRRQRRGMGGGFSLGHVQEHVQGQVR